MKKVLSLSIAALIILATIAVSTWAYFADTETSNNNVFSAGTLDLKINGGNANVSTVGTLSNMKPGTSSSASFVTLSNAGSLTGDLSVSFNVVTDIESTGNTEFEKDSDHNVSGIVDTTGAADGTTLIDSTAAWVTNIYAGCTVAINTTDIRTIISNTATTLTVDAGAQIVNTDIYAISVGELGGQVEIAPFIDVNNNGVFNAGVDIALKSDGTATSGGLQWDTVDNFSSVVWSATDINKTLAGTNPGPAGSVKFFLPWRWVEPGITDNSAQGDSCKLNITFTLKQS